MAELILAFHEDDKEIADQIKASIKNKGHKIILDKIPAPGVSLGEWWSSNYPKAEMIAVLVTQKMANYFDDPSEFSNGDPTRTLSNDEFASNVLPLIIENVETPVVFSNFISVSIINKKPSIIADYIERHLFSGFANSLDQIKKQMARSSFIFLLFSIVLFMALNSDILLFKKKIEITEMITPFFVISLGILGSISYILFNIIGIVNEEAFDVEDTQSNNLRIILGAITGWIFYIFLTHSGYVDELSAKQFLGVAVGIAFLSGFSSKLFIGIINQAIRAVERTVGIEQKPPERKSAVKPS